MTEPVAWDLAERVAIRVARREPLEDSYLYASLEPDFEELTAQAEALVEAETGLRSLAGPARARVTDRQGWVSANIASFQRLLRPVTDRLGAALDNTSDGRVHSGLHAPLAKVSRNVAGTQVGLLLGWMSTRVLGQYDQLLIEDEHPEDQDIVYYVGPNILALEKRFAFPPREFRLWLALHEVTHRMQFTGVPWMRAHFLSPRRDRPWPASTPIPAGSWTPCAGRPIRCGSGQNPFDDGGLLGPAGRPRAVRGDPAGHRAHEPAWRATATSPWTGPEPTASRAPSASAGCCASAASSGGRPRSSPP